jgi:protein-disulfide isomerase
MTQNRIESLYSAALTVSTVVIAVLLIHREYRPAATRQADIQSVRDLPAAEWRNVVVAARADTSTRSVHLVEFLDLECPACRAFNRGTLHDARAKYGDSLTVSFVHLPLSIHRFSRAAANAAECARDQGRLAQFVDAVYAGQDSLGLKSWGKFASAAGVQDTTRYARCIADPSDHAAVREGISLSQRLGINLTPTIIVDGRRFAYPPTTKELDSLLDAAFSRNRRVLARGTATVR